MKKWTENKPTGIPDDMKLNIEKKAARKLKARSQKRNSLWFGLGMFGLVGWSIAVPTLLGIALGLWMDHAWPGRQSWTITLLLVGLAIGCIQAWRWIERESRHD